MEDDFGKLVVRLTVGVLLLFHGVHKVLTGIDPIKHMVAAQGLPDWLSYGVYLGEVVGPILVVIGFCRASAALLIAINMIVAVALVVLNKEAGTDRPQQMRRLQARNWKRSSFSRASPWSSWAPAASASAA